jgi:hypothetical protein
MVPIQDVIPNGHILHRCGGWRFNRQDIDHADDTPVLLHRDVFLPFMTHIDGPLCPCEPVFMRAQDVAGASPYLGACN